MYFKIKTRKDLNEMPPLKDNQVYCVVEDFGFEGESFRFATKDFKKLISFLEKTLSYTSFDGYHYIGVYIEDL